MQENATADASSRPFDRMSQARIQSGAPSSFKAIMVVVVLPPRLTCNVSCGSITNPVKGNSAGICFVLCRAQEHPISTRLAEAEGVDRARVKVYMQF